MNELMGSGYVTKVEVTLIGGKYSTCMLISKLKINSLQLRPPCHDSFLVHPRGSRTGYNCATHPAFPLECVTVPAKQGQRLLTAH